MEIGGIVEHPLDDCYLKVERAKEQIKALQAQTLAWHDKHPLEVELEIGDLSGGQWARFPKIPKPPGRWAVVVGEIGHDLRSALDYLIFQLADEAEEHRTQFPISDGRRAYFKPRKRQSLSYRDKCLHGVPDQWARWIDALQPFNSPVPRGEIRELSILNEISNRDKHKVRLDCLSTIELPFGFLTIDRNNLIEDLVVRRSTSGQTVEIVSQMLPRARKGDQLLAGYTPKTPDEQWGSTWYVFGPRRLRLEDLWFLAGHVEFIVGTFHPAFGSD